MPQKAPIRFLSCVALAAASLVAGGCGSPAHPAQQSRVQGDAPLRMQNQSGPIHRSPRSIRMRRDSEQPTDANDTNGSRPSRWPTKLRAKFA